MVVVGIWRTLACSEVGSAAAAAAANMEARTASFMAVSRATVMVIFRLKA
jgi:predicted dithiol-disulfide oxidoreductase (DUF899 family)